MSNNGFERFEVSYAYDVKLLSKPRKENNYYFGQLTGLTTVCPTSKPNSAVEKNHIRGSHLMNLD